MKFSGPLIAVNDVEVSKKFYQEVLGQKIVLDFGANVTFSGHFFIQAGFGELVGFDGNEIVQGSKSFELYFEEDDLDGFLKHLKGFPDLKYVHDVKEYPWGQRVIRFYDPDLHLIEVGESMEVVVKRFLKQGLSVEETVERTMFPIEFVKKCME
jgi:catechol 2,3-dioxygenase-like lactoylglutathione lyase family enzyme